MAFHDHLSQEMALHHFSSDQHLGENPQFSGAPTTNKDPQPPKDHIHRLIIEAAGKQHLAGAGGPTPTPTWLNSAILRQQSQYADSSFLHLQTNNTSSDSIVAAAAAHADQPDGSNNNGSNLNRQVGENNGNNGLDREIGGGGGGRSGGDGWQNAKYKTEILAHPLYEQLLSAHVACLRIATPVDQLPRIDAQLAQSQHVVAKYSVLGHGNPADDDEKELDQFLVVGTEVFAQLFCPYCCLSSIS